MSVLAVDVRASRVSQAGDPFRLRVAFEGQAGITVVCGSSGAGKSSLLLAILGALRGTTGRITLGDRTLLDSARDRKLPVRERRLGMVFQNAPLFPHLDVLRNVAFGIRGGESLRQARRLLERVGARDLERRRTDELSGGQTQRVALARALGPAPEALLLDEPFSALDVAARHELGQLLIELQVESEIPFVHVTHDPGEALRLGSHLVLLDGGLPGRLTISSMAKSLQS